VTRYPLEISGFTDSNPETIPVVTPFTREPIAEVDTAPDAALDVALANARRIQHESWRKVPAWKRAEILRKTAAGLRDRHAEFSALIAAEGGKPLKDARVETTRAAVTLDECAAVGERLEGRQWSMQRAPGTEGRIAFTLPEPIGVVLAISAFNHPLNLACHQAGTAIAAGNTCILKPAMSTPVCSIELARLMREAGLPEGVLQIAPTPGRRAGRLVQSPDVDFITFIGSAEVGWRIRRDAADGARMAAEHGGNAASIVLADADLDRALPLIVRGSFYHSGQVCVSTQRLYVERSLEPEFTGRLVELSQRLVCGDARDEATDVGALIEPEEVTRVHEWMSEATGAGAEVLLGGEPATETLYPTTIVRGAPEDSKIISHEIFGPVVVVQPVDSLDEAIEKINRSENPFQSSIFTQDIDRAFHAAREVDAAAYMINDLTAFRVDWMPFGGRRNAGLEMGGVEAGIRDMTEEKLIVVNT
jgi:acyl-CoA reductase-like NAD-dependent aldehyde dehydrogenase